MLGWEVGSGTCPICSKRYGSMSGAEHFLRLRIPGLPTQLNGAPSTVRFQDEKLLIHRHSGTRKSSRSLFSLSSYTVWLIIEIHLVKMFLKEAVDILYDVCPGMYIVVWRSPPPLHMVAKAGSETMSIMEPSDTS